MTTTMSYDGRFPNPTPICGEWMYGRAAAVHVAKNKQFFTKYADWPTNVVLPDGSKKLALGVGRIEVPLHVRIGEKHVLKLDGVFYCPDVFCNILSGPMLHLDSYVQMKGSVTNGHFHQSTHAVLYERETDDVRCIFMAVAEQGFMLQTENWAPDFRNKGSTLYGPSVFRQRIPKEWEFQVTWPQSEVERCGRSVTAAKEAKKEHLLAEEAFKMKRRSELMQEKRPSFFSENSRIMMASNRATRGDSSNLDVSTIPQPAQASAPAQAALDPRARAPTYPLPHPAPSDPFTAPPRAPTYPPSGPPTSVPYKPPVFDPPRLPLTAIAQDLPRGRVASAGQNAAQDNGQASAAAAEDQGKGRATRPEPEANDPILEQYYLPSELNFIKECHGTIQNYFYGFGYDPYSVEDRKEVRENLIGWHCKSWKDRKEREKTRRAAQQQPPQLFR